MVLPQDFETASRFTPCAPLPHTNVPEIETLGTELITPSISFKFWILQLNKLYFWTSQSYDFWYEVLFTPHAFLCGWPWLLSSACFIFCWIRLLFRSQLMCYFAQVRWNEEFGRSSKLLVWLICVTLIWLHSKTVMQLFISFAALIQCAIISPRLPAKIISIFISSIKGPHLCSHWGWKP